MSDPRDKLLEFVADTAEGFKKGERVVGYPYRTRDGETVEWATEHGHIIPIWQVKEVPRG